jgi:biopolymer transport protein ExbD
MSISSTNKKGAIFSEINITPLTDIFLVLLIIMMFIAPMFQSVDQNIKLPSINSGMGVEEKEVTVAVTKDSHFFINSAPTDESQLAKQLAALLDTAKDKKVVVKADSQTKTKEIMKIMRAAQEAGYEKLTVAGEPLSKKQQKALEEKVDKLKDKYKNIEEIQ